MSEATEPVVETTAETPEGELEQKLKIAYAVGIREDDSIFFDVGGEEQGLVQLLGLHAVATRKIMEVYDSNQRAGDAVLNAKIDAIGQLVQQMHSAMVQADAPNNKLEQ